MAMVNKRRDFTYVGDVVEANIKASTIKKFPWRSYKYWFWRKYINK